MKYRKNPVVINAWPVSDLLRFAEHEWTLLPQPIINAYESGSVIFLSEKILIETQEGFMRADKYDMIICGIQGELYPCKPDIFAATYEAIPEQEIEQ